MEGYQAPVEQNKTQTGSRLKIFFAILFILLLLGVLNYFNIFSISNFFPKQLDWLPRQAVVQKKLLYTPAKPTLAPTSAVFNYDTEKAKTLLVQYVKDVINPNIIPANIEIKQELDQDGKVEGPTYQFGSFLNTKDYILSTNFRYEEGNNLPNGYGIIFKLTSITQATATASLANQLLSNYFKNPFFVSNCQTKQTMSYCENFQITDNGKTGYGIAIAKQNTKPIVILFNCTVLKNSTNYSSLTSCVSP